MTRIVKDHSNDKERLHIIADQLLCTVLASLGYSEMVKAFKEANKWYA